MEAGLGGMMADPEELIAVYMEMGISGDMPSVEVQKLVMVPKAWDLYFMEP